MNPPIVDLITETLGRRGLAGDQRPSPDGAHFVWEVRKGGPDGPRGHKTLIVISGPEVLANTAPERMKDLVYSKVTLAERTLENLEELERRQLHELELVGRGWTPPPDWKHPRKTEPMP